jgi:hypothetical protein
MPIFRRIAVLQRASAHLPLNAPPDPRRAIEVRAGEDTFIYFEVLDDGGSPVPANTGDIVQFTVRPTPSVDDEKVIRLDLVRAPLEDPNIWLLTLSADFTRRKSPSFTRGFYNLTLIRTNPDRRDFIIEVSPFRLFGSPGAQ